MKLAALLVSLVVLPAAAPTRLAGCPVFPATNAWNQRVDQRPVAANSAAIVNSIGPAKGMHADFGSGLYEGK
ncbi:MAG: hypothetical protein QOF50_1052, partial [Gaiellaceae bacterium]|nr:hypothetical protein [Gaiellaceae bacterium]